MSIFGLIGSADLKTTIEKMEQFNCDDYLLVTKEMTVEDIIRETFQTKGIKFIEILNMNDLELSNAQLFILFKKVLEKGVTIRFIEKVIEISDADYIEIIYFILKRDYEFRSRIQKEKLKEARDKGTQLGRPSLEREEIAKIRALRKDEKLTYREIASRTGISLGTVAKYSKF